MSRKQDLFNYMELLLEMRKYGLKVEDRIENILNELDIELNKEKEVKAVSMKPVDIVVLERSIGDMDSTLDYYRDLFGKETYIKNTMDTRIVEFGKVKLRMYLLSEFNYQRTTDMKLRGISTDYLINNTDVSIPEGIVRVKVKDFR